MAPTARGGAGWSARRAHNPKVVGSNPTPATTERSSSSPFVITPACVRLGNMRTDVRPQSSAAKRRHEFCDPVHDFISVDSDERRVIDSPPLQRLRHIHQLAMTHLVYPGATHRRFEHSLGTMELAGRVYDVITNPSTTREYVREVFPDIDDERKRWYWRRVVRLAALCHDIGHLPFSHAAENELLPDGWSHEKLSRDLIFSELSDLFNDMIPPVKAEHVAKLAVGPKKAPDVSFSSWERILAEIIVGDAFGVDRMDYLLRDSLHAGVVYGNFGHHRLIDTLRILPSPGDQGSSEDMSLGVELGGLQSAEALLMARYFMFSQVYFHRVRMIYDQHLIDFLMKWLPDGRISTDPTTFISLTDNEVAVAISCAARDKTKSGHAWAKRLASRDHFRVLYSRLPQDMNRFSDAAIAVEQRTKSIFGADSIRYARRYDKGGEVNFPVRMDDGKVASSIAVSEVLKKIPVIVKEYVYIDKELLKEGERWKERNLDKLLKTSPMDMEES